MSNTYLAIFTGSKDSPRMKAWMAMSDAERRTREQEGMAAWHAWAARHEQAITVQGGPLGKTKKASAGGIEDISNHLAAFTVVQAESHEAAARLFENHPHFAIFPGDAVEIMPILPIPGA